ncbi:MAG TPA: T9SS type A sorting domain-containing protein [Bacteroidia bacterium]|mgnify:CR=1 FL=1|nr:T9SS type A sorting domain-containing protein [Bacteroidia bacterium]
MKQFTLSLFLFFFFCLNTSAQLSTKSYSTTPSTDGNKDIIVTNEKGYLITSTVNNGSTYYTALTLIDSAQNQVEHIVLRDSLWGALPLDLTRVVHTDDGGYLLAGGFAGFYSSSFDMTLVKTDSALNIEWYKVIHDSLGTSKINSVVKTTDGNLSFNGNLKTDGNGTILWRRRNNYPSQCLLATSTNGFVNAGQDIFAKCDSLCNPLWSYQVPNRTILKAISTLDGGYAFAGFVDSSGLKSTFLFRTDTSGTITFSYKSDFSPDFYFTDLTQENVYFDMFQLSDSNFVIGFPANIYESVLLKLNQQGQFLNARIFGEINTSAQYSDFIKKFVRKSDSVYTFMEDHTSHVSFIVRPLTAELDLNDHTQCVIPQMAFGWNTEALIPVSYQMFTTALLNDSVNDRSMWVYRSAGASFNYCVTTTDLQETLWDNAVEIVFIQTSKEFVVKISGNETRNLFISIYTSSGQLITTSESKVNDEILTQHFSASHYVPGMYVVRALTDRGIMTRKFIVY